MSILIAYATKYGSARKCAEELASKLQGQADIVNLSEKTPDLAKYDKVILGGSIYAGQIHKKMKAFCTENLDKLKEKKLGLYICCMADGDIAQGYLKSSYPETLASKAIDIVNLGGEYQFEKMNFFIRFIIKKIAGTDKNQKNYHADALNQLADKMNQA